MLPKLLTTSEAMLVISNLDVQSCRITPAEYAGNRSCLTVGRHVDRKADSEYIRTFRTDSAEVDQQHQQLYF